MVDFDETVRQVALGCSLFVIGKLADKRNFFGQVPGSRKGAFIVAFSPTKLSGTQFSFGIFQTKSLKRLRRNRVSAFLILNKLFR